MTACIGISLGDITGIGPEVTLKAIAAELDADATRFLLIGDVSHMRRLNDRLGLKLTLENPGGGLGAGRVFVHDPSPGELPLTLHPGAPAAARAALTWLKDGAERCLRGELDALVTAPVNKEAILRTGFSFVGQTELLSQLAGTNRTAMMLLGEDDRGRCLRVVLATTHLPIRRVADSLTREKVDLAIDLAAEACRKLGLPRSRIAICGLNPHAGEGGQLGDEEQTTIIPAVTAAKKRGLDVTGPLAADTVFYYAYRGEYEAVVAMYHDQGLPPLKMIGFEKGVNWTIGLPFVRTSPDHGTAYDIAGQGRANPSSMQSAIRLARKLALPRETRGD